ncbi:MAG TPA: cytochrome b/b6 domain-containing protein [Symbiobacteriaceae bacterium]|nr:cytochrome b/b6 domain-containing protein [Symbiobacteriaceae bacterium]
MVAKHKPQAEHKPAFYQRWNLQHRLQHGTLAASMFGLIISGLAIKFHTAAWAQAWFSMVGFHNNLILHKVSATLLVFVSFWHLAYMLYVWSKERSHPLSWAMMPKLSDARDMYHHALYLLNIRKEPPQYDRYTYLEKFEYLSIFWGMVVMGLTGFSLWFPVQMGSFFSREFLDMFRIIHGNEAVVACIALLYGHFFTVHFNPAVFPSSTVWYNGKISLEHMMEEHPAEYQRLVEKGQLPAFTGHLEHGLSPARKLLAFVELIIYSAIFYWMLISYLPKALA